MTLIVASHMQRNVVSGTVSKTFSIVKGTVKFGGKTLWVVSSSALLLFLPVLYENEMDTAIEMQEKQHSTQQQHLVNPHRLFGQLTYSFMGRALKHQTSPGDVLFSFLCLRHVFWRRLNPFDNP